MARKAMIKLPSFEGVDDSGGNFHIATGEYLMKCVGVSEDTSKQGNEMLVFKFDGLEKAAKGRSFRLHCALIDKALWKLKQTLRALGVEVPDEVSDLDPDDVVGVEVLGTVVDNEYEGKTSSRLGEIRSVDSEVVTDEKPTTKATGKSKNGGKLPKIAASEVENMVEDELIDTNEKYNLDLDLDDYKTMNKKRGAIISSLQAAKMLEA
jgi:hypothetical protein